MYADKSQSHDSRQVGRSVTGNGHYHGQLASHAVGGVVVLSVFLVITLIFTVLRFRARWLTVRRYFASDWTFLAAEFIYIIYTIVSYVSLIHAGIGYHIQELGSEQVELILKLLLVIQITYALCMSLLKVSICLLYNQIFPQRWVRICSYSIMALSVCWALLTILNGLLICRPISALWVPGTGKCGNENAGYSSVSGVELAIDSFIILLPLPVIWRLNMTTISKIATTSLFGLGLITIIVTGVRLHATLTLDFEDFSYTAVELYNLTVIELGVAVMVTSGVGLRPIVERVVQRCRLWSKNSSRGTTKNSDIEKPYSANVNLTPYDYHPEAKVVIGIQSDEDIDHIAHSQGFSLNTSAGSWLESGTDSPPEQGMMITREFSVKSEVPKN